MNDKLDPKPYYLVESDDGTEDSGRYTVEQIANSEGNSALYNLAEWAPRPGYYQDASWYR